MKRPPRRSGEAIFGVREVSLAILQGLIVFVAIVVYFGWALDVAPEAEARGAAFASLVVANLFLALANSAGGRFGVFSRSHTAFWIISGAAGLVLIAVLYAPPLAAILHIADPHWSLLAPGLAVAAIAGGWWGLVKTFGLRLVRQRAV
jgi:Ca2+-transporting ATPase